MLYTPTPGENSVPLHETARVELEPGQKITVTLEPETAPNLHYIPVVAISKRAGAVYSVAVDETTRFGPNSPVPPTDPDDLEPTFLRCLEMNQEMEITIKDVRATGSRRPYQIHVLGWEE